MQPVRVLIVDDNRDVQDVLAFYFEATWNAVVSRASSGDEAIAILAVDPNFALVSSDYHGGGVKLFRYLQGMGHPIPFILVSKEKANEHPEFQGPHFLGGAEKPRYLDAVSAIAQKVFGQGKKEKPPGVYCRIPLSLLSKVSVLPCDLFVRLSEKKFVKVMHENDVFSDSDSERFANKGVLYLHIETIRSTEILNKILREVALSAEMAIAKNLPADCFEISASLQDTVNDLARGLGYDVALEAAVKTNMEITYRFIKNNPRVMHILEASIFKKNNFISSHSILLPYVCFKLVELMDWQSELTFQKLTLSSFLHDATLASHSTSEVQFEIDLTTLSTEEGKAWREHTEKAAEIARRFKEVPPDVDMIISQHHELPDGSGHPNRLHHTRIAPLSALFIVAHDFLFYYDRTKKADLMAFAQERQHKYSQGHFKRIIRSILKDDTAEEAA